VGRADGVADRDELEAVSWIAGTGDMEVLSDLVLPALEKSEGKSENGQAVAEFAARNRRR